MKIARWNLPTSAMLLWALLLTFYLTIVSWPCTAINTGDVFMYLALARSFLENGFYPTQDPFLFLSSEGGIHFHHEWLSYLYFYGAHQLFDLEGLIAAKIVVVVGLFSIPIWFAHRLKFLRPGVLILLIVALMATAARIGERAFLFSDLLTALTLSLLFLYHRTRERKYIVLLPILFLSWVQLHPGFPIGLFLMALFFGLQFFSFDHRERRLWIMTGTLCVVACMLNPLGLEGFLYPLRMFLSSDWNIYRQINSEWMPLIESPYVAPLGKIAVAGLFLLSIWTSLFEIKQKNFFPLIVTLVFGYLCWTSMRFISIAPICFVLVIVRALSHWQTIKSSIWETSATAMFVFALGAYVWQLPNQGLVFLMSDLPKATAPLKAINHLASLPPQTVFAEWDWNSVIAWATKGKHKVVVHGHIDQPKFAVDNFLSINQSPDEFRRIVDKNQVGYFLLSPSTMTTSESVLVRELRNPPWRVIYQDSSAVLFSNR